MSSVSAAPATAPSVLRGSQQAVREWCRVNGPFWAASAGGHLLALALFGLLAGTIESRPVEGVAPEFESVVETQLPEPELTRFEIGETSLEPSLLDTASLLELDAPTIDSSDQLSDAMLADDIGGGTANPLSPLNTGGLGGFTVAATGDGAPLKGLGGIGGGQGSSNSPGSGGAGHGFGGRGAAMHKALSGAFGGTKQTDRAVGGTINWLARHQSPDGSWSLNGFHQQCTDATCMEGFAEETLNSNAAATALALLPFLAAGQTHETRGPYQKSVHDGLYWLVAHQKIETGDLSADSPQQMYTHGLAAIVLCEAYGMTQDRAIGQAAQRGIKFIESTQNEQGGWRYAASSTDSDTSVVGWQLMALKSGQMAGLAVEPRTLSRAKAYLKLVSRGESGGLYVYTPDQEAPQEVMTAVGLLGNQYMGMSRNDPAMVEGMRFLMDRLPNPAVVNSYYWYYATQVMHNLPGPEWDQWNREMRRALLDSQATEGCASGSWNPGVDAWGKQGGRVMTTAIDCLSLEVYYRYIPLYKLTDPAVESASAR